MQRNPEVDHALKRYGLDELVPVLVLWAAEKLDGSTPCGKTPHDYVQEAFDFYFQTEAGPAVSLIGALCSTIAFLIRRDRDAERAEKRRLFRRL